MALIRRLAEWSADLSPDAVPVDVVERVRLQHLALGGAWAAAGDLACVAAARKAAAPRGASPVPGGRGTARRDAVRLLATGLTALELDDFLLGGHTGAAAASVTWALSKGRSVDELVAATVVANELGARLGASHMMSRGSAQPAVASLAAAAAAARLLRLDADATAHALALAIAAPRRIADDTLMGSPERRGPALALPIVDGFDAAVLAAAGVEGPLDVLDSRCGFYGDDDLPLRAAFTGLGTCWLTRTLAYKPLPGCAWLQVPIQATREILRRHVQAADKRLRANQVVRIELALPAPCIALEARVARVAHASSLFSVRRAIGALCVAYELGPEQLTAGWLAKHRDAVERIAAAVEVRHDWQLSVAMVEQLLDVAAPLLAGVTPAELRDASQRLLKASDVPAPAGKDLLALLKARPDRVLATLGRSSGDLGDLDADAWRYTLGLQMKLFTTRGGWWPERRDTLEGGPGWAWADTVELVRAKHAQSDDARREAGEALLAAAGSDDAAGWVGWL